MSFILLHLFRDIVHLIKKACPHNLFGWMHQHRNKNKELEEKKKRDQKSQQNSLYVHNVLHLWCERIKFSDSWTRKIKLKCCKRKDMQVLWGKDEQHCIECGFYIEEWICFHYAETSLSASLLECVLFRLLTFRLQQRCIFCCLWTLTFFLFWRFFRRILLNYNVNYHKIWNKKDFLAINCSISRV